MGEPAGSWDEDCLMPFSGGRAVEAGMVGGRELSHGRESVGFGEERRDESRRLLGSTR